MKPGGVFLETAMVPGNQSNMQIEVKTQETPFVRSSTSGDFVSCCFCLRTIWIMYGFAVFHIVDPFLFIPFCITAWNMHIALGVIYIFIVILMVWLGFVWYAWLRNDNVETRAILLKWMQISIFMATVAGVVTLIGTIVDDSELTRWIDALPPLFADLVFRFLVLYFVWRFLNNYKNTN